MKRSRVLRLMVAALVALVADAPCRGRAAERRAVHRHRARRERRGRAGRQGHRQERADRRGAHRHDQRARAATSSPNLRPSVVHASGRPSASSRRCEYTGLQLAGGTGVRARPAAAGRPGVTETVTVQAQFRRDRPEFGAPRRQRQRARSAEPAGQRPPDVAADAAGAGLAELRHRHVAGRPLQRPRRRAERHPLRRRRGLGDHRRGAGQPERRDSHAVQAAGEPRERAGVPRRVEQLPGRVRHRHRRPGQRRHQVGQQLVPRRRCSSTYRNDKFDAPNYFDTRGRACRSRSSNSTSSAARSAARSRRTARSSSAATKATGWTPA